MATFIPFFINNCIRTLIFLVIFLQKSEKSCIFAAESLIIIASTIRSPLDNLNLDTFCV